MVLRVRGSERSAALLDVAFLRCHSVQGDALGRVLEAAVPAFLLDFVRSRVLCYARTDEHHGRVDSGRVDAPLEGRVQAGAHPAPREAVPCRPTWSSHCRTRVRVRSVACARGGRDAARVRIGTSPLARPASRPTHVVLLLSRRYHPFVWPVPKGCPAGDPTVAAPVARGTRPPGDYERERASIARGEEMAHSGTNNGAPSQCRAAAQSTARARNRQEDARVALALAQGNNPIEEGKYYIVCFELNEEPDELFFTLMLATNVSVSLRGHRCVFRCADLENRPSLHLVLVGLNSAVYCDGF